MKDDFGRSEIDQPYISLRNVSLNLKVVQKSVTG